MQYYKIGKNSWQRVDGVHITNVWESGDSISITTEMDTDPLGPMKGSLITEEEFNSKLNQIYEAISKNAATSSHSSG
jgi:hypothetical protein